MFGNVLETSILGTDVGESYDYDKRDRRTRTTIAPNTDDAVSLITEYNRLDQVTRTVDAGGFITQYFYDGKQDVESTVFAVGTPEEYTILYEHDDVGNQISISDPRSETLVTTRVFDGLGRVVELSQPFGSLDSPETATTFFEYDAIGNLISESDPRDPSLLTRYEYDAAGRMTQRTDAIGGEWVFGYDAGGNNTTRTTPIGQTETFYFDGLNRPLGVSDDLGNTSCNVYDAVGNVVAEIHPRAGLSACGVTTTSPSSFATLMTYDNLDRLVSVVDPEGDRTDYSYDNADRLLSVTDGRTFEGLGEFITRFEYDYRGNVVLEQRPGGISGIDEILTYEYEYSSRDQLLRTVDPRGVAIDYEYDALERRTKMTQQVSVDDHDAPDEVTEYRYDAASNLVEVIDPRGTFFNQTFTYDAANLIASETVNRGTPLVPGPTATTFYRYDAAGNEVEVIDPRGTYFTTTSVYDDLGRLVEVVEPRGLPGTPRPSAVTTFDYDAVSRITTQVGPLRDRSGERVTATFEYDDADRLLRSVDAIGAATRYEYDEAGNIETEIYEAHTTQGFQTAERMVQHEYDANNRIIATIDALDRRTTYTYDAIGQIVASTLPLHNGASNSSLNSFVYDGIGRLRESTDGLSQTTKFGYDGVGNQTSVTDPRGDFYTTVSEYDGLGRRVTLLETTGTPSAPGAVARTEFVYQDAGSVVREIDPRGPAFETVTHFDIEGQIGSIDQADGRSEGSLTRIRTDYEFDAAGFVVAERDHRGRIFDTLFQYDAVGNLLRIDSPVGSVDTPGRRIQQFTYNEEGKPTEVNGYGGVADVTRYEYDAAGRMTVAIDPLGNRTDWVVDRYGNRQQTSDRFGATTVTYDAGDRATRIIDALGQETRFNYAAVGDTETITQTDPRGNTHTTQFDVLGRPVVQINPLNQRTTFGYDAAGNPTRIIDANGVLHETEFDARNLPVRESNAVGTEDAISIHMNYDLLGREIRRTDPRDSQGNFYAVETEYDALSRPIRTTRSAATPTHPDSDRATSTDSNGQLVEEIFYDSAGNVIRVVPEGGESFAETFTYDLANRPTSHTMPTGVEDAERQSTTHYVYDNRDRLVETTNPLGHTTSWEYDLIDRVTQRRIASNERGDLVETYEYTDEFGGNRLTVTDATGTIAEVHHFDALGRVDRVEQRGNPDLIRQFDASGNLILEEQGRWSENYSYDARDYQVGITDAAGNTRVLEYDAVGNLLSDRLPGNSNAVEFTYDALNRVRTRTDGVGSATTYEYDAAGASDITHRWRRHIDHV